VTDPHRYTHVRLTIHPDGGVARLWVHGDPVADPRLVPPGALDLAALEHGARITGCSNWFYSTPNNLIAPGRAAVMGEGWETARRRVEGHEWVTVALVGPGVPVLAELDTSHFKGNAPGWAELLGRDGDGQWRPVLPRTRLQPDTRHRFPITRGEPGGEPGGEQISHLRLNIHPDGGMARLRLHGNLTPAGYRAFVVKWFNPLPVPHGLAVLTAGAGATERRARELLAARPLDPTAELPAELAHLHG
jgi:allantoicase